MGNRRRYLVATGFAIAMLASGGAGISAATIAGASDAVRMPVSVQPRCCDLESPIAVSSDGSDVWVGNTEPQGSVVEFSAASGSLVRWINNTDCPSCHFQHEEGLASVAGNVWVVNGPQSSVIELAAKTGSLIRVINDRNCRSCHLSSPTAVAADGGDVWVTNAGTTPSGPGSVTELSATTGRLVRWIHDTAGPALGRCTGCMFHLPQGVATDGVDVWITNEVNNSVTELSASTGKLVEWIHVTGNPTLGLCPNCHFSLPQGIASNGTEVWVANPRNNSITELPVVNPAQATWFNSSNCSACGFFKPRYVSLDAGHVWVSSHATITELTVGSGVFTQRIDASSCVSCHIKSLAGISDDGSHVWVVNANGVIELSAATGALVRVI